MALLIDDPKIEAEILAESERNHISPEEVVRRALDAQRTQNKARLDGVVSYLEVEVWPNIPAEQLGKRLSKAEEEAILGYGPDEY